MWVSDTASFARVITTRAFPDDRLLPLCDKGIPCAVWVENALAHNGVSYRMISIDFVLVTDIEMAAHELIELAHIASTQGRKTPRHEYNEECAILVSPHATGAETLNEEAEDPNAPQVDYTCSAAGSRLELRTHYLTKIDISQGAIVFFPVCQMLS